MLTDRLTDRYERWLLAFILAAYLLLSLGFSLGPIFEGPDEIEHYRFVSTLAQTGALPDARSQPRSEYHQAPLYYVLLMPVALLVNGTDFSRIDGRLNPFYPYQPTIPGNDNKNLYLHSSSEQFPYTASSTALAVHLMRLLSIALGAGTLVTCYAIFRLLWPTRPDRRLLAISVAAFTPGFLYMSSTINNDALLFLLSTLTLFLLLRQYQRGPSSRMAFWLGLVLGAALLTKVSALFLVFPVGLAVLLTPHAWRYMPRTLGVIVAVAGWWYLRNWLVYGDPTAVRVLLETWKTESIRAGSLALDIGIPRAFYAYQSYWARFGEGAVSVADWIYTVFNGITIVALLGLFLRLMQHIRHHNHRPEAVPNAPPHASQRAFRQAVIVGGFGVTWVAAIVYYASTAWSGNQGRYALPGLAAWAALITWGLDAWTPARVRLRVVFSLIAALVVIAVLCVFTYFLPAYIPSAATGPIARPLALTFADHNKAVAELVGMSPAAPKARPGDIVQVTLYWRALQPTDQPLQVFLHSQDSSVVRRDSWPGTGNLLSTEWQAGQTWAEAYSVEIPPDAPPQTAYPLLASLYDPNDSTDDHAVTVSDAAGHLVLPLVGQIGINGPQATVPGQSIDFKFADAIGLDAPAVSRTGDQLKVCLTWYSLSSTTVDYHVFIHVLVGESDELVAQSDSQPKAGHYPTSAWSPGEAIEDCTTISVPNLPQSGWRVGIGLYNFETGQRLAARTQAGLSLLNDTVLATPQPQGAFDQPQPNSD